MTNTDRPFFLKVWRFGEDNSPESALAHQPVKDQFWRRFHQLESFDDKTWLDVDTDAVAAEVAKPHEKSTGVIKDHREGDPTEEYDTSLISKMEECTPQFNLRNVMRVRREADPDFIEWNAAELPDRHGYNEDLAMVRSARLDPPVFLSDEYSSTVLRSTQRENRRVFFINDWEQWYGEDKKRLHGSLWHFVPENGGIRTRPWEKIKIIPHKYWKGRLIQEQY